MWDFRARQARRSSLEPDRIFQLCDKRGVCSKLSGAGLVCPGGVECSVNLGNTRLGADRCELQPDLPAPEQFDIDLREQLSVEQRAMMGPHRTIDGKAAAKRIKTVFRAREFASRNGECIGCAFGEDRRFSAAFELGIEEVEVERCVVRDQLIIANKFQKFINYLGKPGLVGKELCRKAMDRDNFGGNVAVRVQVDMKNPAGFDAVNQLDAADLNEAVAVRR